MKRLGLGRDCLSARTYLGPDKDVHMHMGIRASSLQWHAVACVINTAHLLYEHCKINFLSGELACSGDNCVGNQGQELSWAEQERT